MNNQYLSSQQLSHLIQVIRLRYISPYKIIYMISQQQADIFKIRNQSTGCCSSSSITIPKHQMTKTQLFLSQCISNILKPNKLNEILQQLSNKYENIVKSGQKQSLKVDDNVEKFLIQKVMSEGINLYIYNQVINKLKKQTQSISNSAMLWATPNTWYAKYPKTKLEFIKGQSISMLNNKQKGYCLEKDFLKDYKDNLYRQLRLLQRDGRFQQLLWSKNVQHLRNDKKLMNFPQNYAFDGTQQQYKQGMFTYPHLKRSLLTLRSIPFQFNSKLNNYCTISQNNQISYFKSQMNYIVQTDQKSKYSTFCPIGDGIKCQIQVKNRRKQNYSEQESQKIQIKDGDLLIIDNFLIKKIILSSKKCQHLFLFKSWIFTLQKN